MEKDNIYWECSACQTINDEHKQQCIACGTNKPIAPPVRDIDITSTNILMKINKDVNIIKSTEPHNANKSNTISTEQQATSSNITGIGKASIGKAPIDKTLIGKAPIDKTLINKASDKTPTNKQYEQPNEQSPIIRNMTGTGKTPTDTNPAQNSVSSSSVTGEDPIDANVYLLIPDTRMSATDNVLCNENFAVGERISPAKGIMCKNYRKIIKTTAADPLPRSVIKYNVASVQINEDGNTYDFPKIIADYCTEVVGEDYSGINLIDKDKIVYFKGAYVTYTLNDMSNTVTDVTTRAAFNAAHPNVERIYKNAAKPVLAQTLLLLKRMGYETIIVDPEPGFHPATSGRTDVEKREGLVRLYKEFGLKEYKCKGTSIGVGLLLNMAQMDDSLFNLVDGKISDPELSAYGLTNAPIMVGKIDTMINKIDWRGIFGSICSILPIEIGSRIRQCRDVLSVPANVTSTVGDIDNEIKNEHFDELITNYPRLDTSMVGGSNEGNEGDKGNEYKKYIKYKAKYMRLKNKLEMIKN